jgi:hypothetical protein
MTPMPLEMIGVVAQINEEMKIQPKMIFRGQVLLPVFSLKKCLMGMYPVFQGKKRFGN